MILWIRASSIYLGFGRMPAPSRTPSVSGTRLCLSVDLKDGAGYRFLAEDARRGPEMYSHDVEYFGSPLTFSCDQPIGMVRQTIQDYAGTWSTLSGRKWTFRNNTSKYSFQNITLYPSGSWSVCG